MPKTREIKTCSRCRELKLRCDRVKPSCRRCTEGNVSCSFRIPFSAIATGDELSSPRIDTTGEDPKRSSIEDVPVLILSHDHVVPSGDHRKTMAVKASTTVRRRQRAHLSCTRCFRLKVKCNKELPCSRCRISGWGRYCGYNHRVEGDTLASAAHTEVSVGTRGTGDDLDRTAALWHAQRRGATHWKELLSQLKLQAALVDITICHSVSHVIHRKKDMKGAGDSVLPSNFPFNSPAAGKFLSLDRVHDLLQSHREACQSYIDGYLALYQPIYPIVDVPRFRSMVAQFWNDPDSASVSCLANFLTVLALGCFAVTRDQELTVEFCMAAEASLSKTEFMVRSDISAMRTLCLMVIVKLTTNATCQTFDSCWTFLGIVMRVAVGMDLHKPIKPSHQNSVEAIREWQSGRTLWSILVYFCIHMAIITGKPPLISVDDITTEPSSPTPSSETMDTWVELLETYPTVCRIVARMNNATDKPSPDEIQEYNAQLRQSMALLDNIHGKPLLYITLDIFFRRLLLVLHRLQALHPCSPSEYTVSYWSSLECSLAILVHHRDLFGQEGRSLGDVSLLGRLFKLDFFSAMLTVSLHLLRHDASLATGFAMTPRQTILDTLQACTEIWEREIHNSMCFEIGHTLLTSVLGILSDTDRNGHLEGQPPKT